jgi:putative ubiquitin-RnfH superfamily antitoxin RatB of RatAB toxin-antitoxin module
LAPTRQVGVAIELVVTSSSQELNRALKYSLELPEPMTIDDLLDWLLIQKTQGCAELAEAMKKAAGFSVFGRAVSANTLLNQGDRLELLNPLLADPKLARRQRVQASRSEQASKGRFDRWTRNR